MDHEPHIGLVDPHAESIGGDNDAQPAVDEGLLNVLLGFRRQPSVKVPDRPAFVPQKFSHLLGLLSCRAIDDRATAIICRKIGLQYLMDVGILLGRTGRHDTEIKIGSCGTTIETVQVDANLVLEMSHDIHDDIGLRGGCQAKHWRNRLASCLFANEAIVRPKILPPLGKAMRLIEHPGTDLTLRQHRAQRAVAQLLG